MAFMKAEVEDPLGMFQEAFPEMKDKTAYYDPFNKIDLSDQLQDATDARFEKATNAGAASGAAGFAMIPLAYDREVVDITRKVTPLLGLIPKETNLGTTANYNRITARGAPEWGTESGALNEVDDTGELVSEDIKYCRITGKVTGVAQSGSKHFIDSMRQQVLNKTQSMNEELEDVLVNGDATTNPLEPDGLIQMIDGGSGNKTDLSGEDVSLTDIRDLLSDCFYDKGKPNLLITDSYTATKIENQMMDYVRYKDPYQQIAWGTEALSLSSVVGRLPIMVSQFMPVTSGSRRILAVDTNMVRWRVLQDISFEKLAKTEDAEKFYLKTYRTLINKFPEGMGMLYGIN